MRAFAITCCPPPPPLHLKTYTCIALCVVDALQQGRSRWPPFAWPLTASILPISIHHFHCPLKTPGVPPSPLTNQQPGLDSCSTSLHASICLHSQLLPLGPDHKVAQPTFWSAARSFVPTPQLTYLHVLAGCMALRVSMHWSGRGRQASVDTRLA